MVDLGELTHYTSLISFVIGFPMTAATYYTVWRTRRENKQARQGLIYSRNCLEFVLESGTFINLVPLETLHSLPKPQDVVLLPGPAESPALYGAYRVTRIEHIYARVDEKHYRPGQARLAKAVAHVEALNGASSAV